MISVIGWIGSVCFALCGVPQAVACYRQGHAKGISTIFLLLWASGEVLYIIAVFMEFGFVAWMMANYFTNLVSISVIIRYRFWARRF